MPKDPDLISRIMAFEDGALDHVESLELFAELLRTGIVWELQGGYGRTAATYIHLGWITPNGTITSKGRSAAEDADG